MYVSPEIIKKSYITGTFSPQLPKLRRMRLPAAVLIEDLRFEGAIYGSWGGSPTFPPSVALFRWPCRCPFFAIGTTASANDKSRHARGKFSDHFRMARIFMLTSRTDIASCIICRPHRSPRFVRWNNIEGSNWYPWDNGCTL